MDKPTFPTASREQETGYKYHLCLTLLVEINMKGLVNICKIKKKRMNKLSTTNPRDGKNNRELGMCVWLAYLLQNISEEYSLMFQYDYHSCISTQCQIPRRKIKFSV